MPWPPWSNPASMSRTEQPPAASARPRLRRPDWRLLHPAVGPERRFKGIPVSDGIAVGAGFGDTEPPAEAPHRSIQPAEVDRDLARLEQAIAQSRKQLNKLRSRLSVLPEE